MKDIKAWENVSSVNCFIYVIVKNLGLISDPVLSAPCVLLWPSKIWVHFRCRMYSLSILFFCSDFREPNCLEKLLFTFSCVAERKLCLGGQKKRGGGDKIKLMKSSVMAFSKEIVICAYIAFEYLFWPRHWWSRAWSKLIHIKRSFSLLQTEIKLSSFNKIWVIVHFRVRQSLIL